jgi:multidrug resistance efflux pump
MKSKHLNVVLGALLALSVMYGFIQRSEASRANAELVAIQRQLDIARQQMEAAQKIAEQQRMLAEEQRQLAEAHLRRLMEATGQQTP